MSDRMYRAFTPDSKSRGPGGRTVRGIAVPYGQTQRIDRNLTEEFCRGAFDHQLPAIDLVDFYRDHATHGGTRIGRQVEGRDDAAGLYGEWRVSKTVVGDETLELVKDGALSQLSVGFRALPGGSRVVNGVTRRTKADLFEVAVVPQGAYGDGAVITGIRSAVCPGCGRPDRARLRQAAALLSEVNAGAYRIGHIH